jgi:hypothetical protein
MADSTLAPDTPSDGNKKQKKGGLGALIRKNKTLAAVLGAGGLYFLWKMKQEPKDEVKAVGEGEGEGLQGAYEGTATLAAYEVGRSERAVERAEEETAEMEAERIKEREKNKEEKEEKEENKPGKPEPEPGPTSDSPSPSADSNGITLHGKNFPGATGSHIAGSGATPGGKKYIEYAVQFPGRVEHWRYFTATQNWQQVKNSAGGAGGNNTGGSGGGTGTAGTAGKNTHGGTPKPTHKIAVGSAVAVSTTSPPHVAVNTQGGIPQQNAQHPAAVNTGNRCVNGGVGGHTPPPGWHLFCQGGYIWRAPNN